MSEVTYDLHFKGDLLDGHFVDFVKADIQALFKANDDYVAKLFSGDDVIIKRSVDKATAIRFQQAFKKAGAKLIVRPHGSAPPAPKPTSPSPKEAAAPAPTPADQPRVDEPSEQLTASLSGPSAGENDDDLVQHHQKEVTAPSEVPSWQVSAPGALLTEGNQTEDTPKVQAPDFDVAEAGADLLTEKSAPLPTPDLDLSELSLAEAGADLDTLKEDKPPVQVDISHLSTQ